jgi:hypothetical protein
MANWIKDFSKEMEKLSFPLLNTMMNASMLAGTASDIKQSQQKNKLQSLKQNEGAMQLPPSSNINPGDSQKLNPNTNSAKTLY